MYIIVIQTIVVRHCIEFLDSLTGENLTRLLSFFYHNLSPKHIKRTNYNRGLNTHFDELSTYIKQTQRIYKYLSLIIL